MVIRQLVCEVIKEVKRVIDSESDEGNDQDLVDDKNLTGDFKDLAVDCKDLTGDRKDLAKEIDLTDDNG